MMSLYVIILTTIISLGFNPIAKAGTWTCLTKDCQVGNIMTDNDVQITNKDDVPPRHHKTRIWHPDGKQTIIDESEGTTRVWHPDGSQTIIKEEDE